MPVDWVMTRTMRNRELRIIGWCHSMWWIIIDFTYVWWIKSCVVKTHMYGSSVICIVGCLKSMEIIPMDHWPTSLGRALVGCWLGENIMVVCQQFLIGFLFMDSCLFLWECLRESQLLVRGFVVGLLDGLTNSCAPKLLWDIRWHVRFCSHYY